MKVFFVETIQPIFDQFLMSFLIVIFQTFELKNFFILINLAQAKIKKFTFFYNYKIYGA